MFNGFFYNFKIKFNKQFLKNQINTKIFRINGNNMHIII